MKKYLYIFLGGILILIIFITIFGFFRPLFLKNKNADIDPVKEAFDFNLDVKNMTYNVEGEIFTLENGVAEIGYGDSDTKNILMSFDKPTYGDLDGDGDNDSALWLMNDPGGTGKFYYAVLGINTGTSYQATNVFLLGDRIAPQPILIINGQAVYNFKDRKEDDPMSAEPTVPKSVFIKYSKETGEISI